MLELEVQSEQLGVEHALGLFEQLLAGLVALQHDDPQLLRHGQDHTQEALDGEPSVGTPC